MKKLFVMLLVAVSPLPASATITYSFTGINGSGFVWTLPTYFADNDIIILSAAQFASFSSCTGENGGACLAPYIVTNADAGEVIDFNTQFLPSASYIFAMNSFFTPGTYYASNADGSIVVTDDNPELPTAPVPEPAMLGLFGMGAVGLGLSRRRRRA